MSFQNEHAAPFFSTRRHQFLLTNRVPRIALTRFMGWFSKLRSPWLARASIALWRLFTDLDLSEAKTQHYASLHDCFTRELRPGARPINTADELLCSPSDGIVGACAAMSTGPNCFRPKVFRMN
jgi:phosphatidylserine decarboxylase